MLHIGVPLKTFKYLKGVDYAFYYNSLSTVIERFSDAN